MADTFEAVLKRFKCSNLVNDEYKRRAISQAATVQQGASATSQKRVKYDATSGMSWRESGTSQVATSQRVTSESNQRRLIFTSFLKGETCARTIYNVFLRYVGDRGATSSGIKISRYNRTQKSFEIAAEIRIGLRTHFQVVLHKNKIIVLGGKLEKNYLKSVSIE